MRLAPIAPQNLTAEQRPLYDDMKAGIEAKYSLFTTIRDDGAITGPWNAWLNEPEVGAAFWNTTKAMTRFSVIPDRIRQIVILVVGTRFGAAYELYAHGAVARKHGLSDQFISTLVSGSRPEGMTDEEGLAYDVAHALSAGHKLPDGTYRRAIALFGQRGTNELIYLVGHYCFVSVTLNGFDIPVPVE
ncbi:carboxymuconolactone decarboxylase family protein [Paraburkholderia sediminicola]|uniref:carboxymuconolactone decarboxylase family protein n=1 Tax=Paraburkholderia sediminicola TaxID=458836 RepID=UPI0038BC0600